MAVVPKDELVEIEFETSNVEKALNYLSIFSLRLLRYYLIFIIFDVYPL